MTFFRLPNSIYAITSLKLALGLFIFVLLALLLVFYFVLEPMANRAADDMAALMDSVSHSWKSLPVEKREEFQFHYREHHQLFITDKQVPVTDIKSYYPFIPRLEKALLRHTGVPLIVKQGLEEKLCFWVAIPHAEKLLRIGFLHERFGPHPHKAMIGIMIVGCILILIFTLLIVRRITLPIKALSVAVNQLGSGKLSTRIPETGMDELVTLACNFNQMAQKINQLMTNRTILFGGISHDLRTPITRMQVALELLKDDQNTSLISKMRNDLFEMERLIQQALEFVRGMDKHQAVNIDINKVIGDIVADYQRQDQLIHWQSSECGICKIEVIALQRVLCNLLDNAFRYGNGAPVFLSCLKDKNKLKIFVQDQGPGIPEDKLETVFQPFFRLDNSRNKKTGGSGLGLAIVRQLCDIHDWKIELAPLNPKEKKGLKATIEIADEN